jgi:hypothetical protein
LKNGVVFGSRRFRVRGTFQIAAKSVKTCLDTITFAPCVTVLRGVGAGFCDFGGRSGVVAICLLLL